MAVDTGGMFVRSVVDHWRMVGIEVKPPCVKASEVDFLAEIPLSPGPLPV